MDIAVIGAGLGGLTFGAFADREGHRVHIFDKNHAPGGVVPIWNQKNPPHETGVKGLYFVGQQSENGGGVGAVMTGAKAAWEKAKEDTK